MAVKAGYTVFVTEKRQIYEIYWKRILQDRHLRDRHLRDRLVAGFKKWTRVLFHFLSLSNVFFNVHGVSVLRVQFWFSLYPYLGTP